MPATDLILYSKKVDFYPLASVPIVQKEKSIQLSGHQMDSIFTHFL